MKSASSVEDAAPGVWNCVGAQGATCSLGPDVPDAGEKWLIRKENKTLIQRPSPFAPSQVIEYNPSQCLDWLAVQTPRNKLAHSWVLQNMENWVERFLLAHNYPRVRTCKAGVGFLVSEKFDDDLTRASVFLFFGLFCFSDGLKTRRTIQSKNLNLFTHLTQLIT